MTEIKIIVDKNSKIMIAFNGFIGSTCYSEHQKLTEILKRLGVQEKVESTQPKEEQNAEVKEHAEVKS